ncbi:MAG: transglycosylase SLT domain-containing protein [Candidatus Veblenbacteria bacterium]|nr:transglycosylase SLT domain-containing protein [Candidatus Veblenbacteria bacterium]
MNLLAPAPTRAEAVIPESITPPAAFLLWGKNQTNEPTVSEFGTKLLEAIHITRSKLQEQVDRQALDSTYHPRVVTSREVSLEIIVALWNPQGNEFDMVRVLKNRSTLTPLTSSPYRFRLKTNNGVNSEIEVTNRPDLYVLGLIHPVFADIGTTTRPRFRLDNVVYVPYSEQLNEPALVAAGEEYLNNKITAVYDELKQLGVRSYTEPNRPLAETIDPSIVKTILAIEHVNAAVLLQNDPSDYLKRFYVTLAGNEHASYAYAKSSASARGLMQFIPSTYHSLRKLRPELTLHTDFVQGMTDPFNAIKASVALLDYNLSLLPKELRQQYQSNPKQLGSYLAAMYNGGPARVRRAIAAWGEGWAKYHGNTTSSLRSETTAYVAKFNLVFDHFHRGQLHLANAAP